MRPVPATRSVRSFVVALALLVCGCGAERAREAAVEPWPEAEALFRSDPHWLGGDAVYSVPLDATRILWLFGDSFVALDGKGDRRSATMVRNTIAVQSGRAPATARISFHHGTTADGAAAPFFADAGDHGLWPLHGHRVPGGPLFLFQTLVRNTPGVGLGFAIDGSRLVRIAEPDRDPATWTPREVPVRGAPEGVVLGTAVWREGDHLIVLGTRGSGPHEGVLVRFAIAGGELLPECEVWLGARFAAPSPGREVPTVLGDAGPECSVDRLGAGWLHVASRGFGATTLAVRTAPRSTGPWSGPRDVFVPPESLAPRAFVYAGKAHPALDAGADWLAVSYATNAFAFAELFGEHGQRALYWPRFVRVPLSKLAP